MTGKLPTTDSIRELAEFWSTHDVTDFEDELEVVESPFVKTPAITIHLQPDEVSTVDKLAHENGMDVAALIKQWVQEKIQLAA